MHTYLQTDTYTIKIIKNRLVGRLGVLKMTQQIVSHLGTFMISLRVCFAMSSDIVDFSQH